MQPLWHALQRAHRDQCRARTRHTRTRMRQKEHRDTTQRQRVDHSLAFWAKSGRLKAECGSLLGRVRPPERTGTATALVHELRSHHANRLWFDSIATREQAPAIPLHIVRRDKRALTRPLFSTLARSWGASCEREQCMRHEAARRSLARLGAARRGLARLGMARPRSTAAHLLDEHLAQ